MTLTLLCAAAYRLRDTVSRRRVLLLVVLALIFAGMFAIKNMSEVARIARTVSEANPPWIIAALLVQLLVIGFAGLSYKIVMRTLGYRLGWRGLANLHLRRHVVGTITPIGGPASVYVFIRTLNARGVSTHDALFGAAIRGVTGYSSFVVLLIPVLLFGHPNAVTLAGAVALLLFLAALVTLMVAFLRKSCNPGWLMPRLPGRTLPLIQQARSHELRVRDLAAPFSLALVHNALGVATLYLCLHAVGERPSLVIPLAGYAIGTLFMMVAPVFQGIGVVELTMALALQQLGIPAPAAIAATILFRLSDLWFPLALGVGSHVFGSALSWSPQVRGSLPGPATIATAATLVVLTAMSGWALAGDRLPELPAIISVTAVIAALVWCTCLSYAALTQRPLAPPVALPALAVSASILAVQDGAVDISLTLPLLQVVKSLIIG